MIHIKKWNLAKKLSSKRNLKTASILIFERRCLDVTPKLFAVITSVIARFVPYSAESRGIFSQFSFD